MNIDCLEGYKKVGCVGPAYYLDSSSKVVTCLTSCYTFERGDIYRPERTVPKFRIKRGAGWEGLLKRLCDVPVCTRFYLPSNRMYRRGSNDRC